MLSAVSVFDCFVDIYFEWKLIFSSSFFSVCTVRFDTHMQEHISLCFLYYHNCPGTVFAAWNKKICFFEQRFPCGVLQIKKNKQTASRYLFFFFFTKSRWRDLLIRSWQFRDKSFRRSFISMFHRCLECSGGKKAAILWTGTWLWQCNVQMYLSLSYLRRPHALRLLTSSPSFSFATMWHNASARHSIHYAETKIRRNNKRRTCLWPRPFMKVNRFVSTA